ncbi:hypothetical protein [Paraburkholderia sp. MM5482-R1]|uniref:hypothetical protein n=1 Tax=unclassified Paraburkholderia TaxID=2615204 RepID=UPI003D1CC11E
MSAKAFRQHLAAFEPDIFFKSRCKAERTHRGAREEHPFSARNRASALIAYVPYIPIRRQRPMLEIEYTRTQVEEWIGSDRLAAVSLLNGYCVDRLRFGDQSLTAQVVDASRHTYSVRVSFYGTGRSLQQRAVCSCPAQTGCDHAALTLLAGADASATLTRAVRPDLQNWLMATRKQLTAAPTRQKAATLRTGDALLYLIYFIDREAFAVAATFGTLGTNGNIATMHSETYPLGNLPRSLHYALDDDDIDVIRYVLYATESTGSNRRLLAGKKGSVALSLMVATGRLWFCTSDGGLRLVGRVSRGTERIGKIKWELDDEGKMFPHLCVDPATAVILPADPPWFVDMTCNQIGPVALPMAPDALRLLLAIPPVSASEVEYVTAAMAPHMPGLAPISSPVARPVRTVDVEPTPVLTLQTTHRSYYPTSSWMEGGDDHALFSFDYDGIDVSAGTDSVFFRAGSHPIEIKRKPRVESRRRKELKPFGFHEATANRWPQEINGKDKGKLLLDPDDWERFVKDGIPLLRSQGWRIPPPRNSGSM